MNFKADDKSSNQINISVAPIAAVVSPAKAAGKLSAEISKVKGWENAAAAPKDKVIIQENLIDEKVDENKAERFLLRETVDPKYFHYGNLTDCMKMLSAGQLPSLHEFKQALIDVLDEASFHLFAGVLLPMKMEGHTGSQFIDQKISYATQDDTKTSEKTIGKPEVTHTKECDKDIVKTVETKEHNSSGIKYNVTQVHETTYRSNPQDIGKSFDELQESLNKKSPLEKHDFALIEQSDINIKATVVSATTEQTKMVAGFNVGFAAGKKQLVADTTTTSTGTEQKNLYLIDGNDLAAKADNNKLTPESLHGGRVISRETNVVNGEIQRSVDNTLKYESGLIENLPFIGGTARIASKMYYGEEVTMSDAFWAGVDAASFMLPIGIFSKWGGKMTASFVKQNSVILGENLAKKGVVRQAETAAHHIVAATEKAAAPARRILTKFGIDINAAENGIFLPNSYKSTAEGTIHIGSHGREYYDYVNRVLRPAKTQEQVFQTLADLRSDLLNGKLPLNTRGAQV